MWSPTHMPVTRSLQTSASSLPSPVPDPHPNAHGAFTRGYDVILVSDAHTTGDKSKRGAPGPAEVIAHTNLYWTYHTGPGRSAGTAKTADVDFHEGNR